MIGGAFRDIWLLVMFLKFSNCTRLRLVRILRTLKISLVPIYHEMHSRPYDFLYLLSIVNWIDVSQECPPGSASFRDAQCSLFNRRDIFINGQKARWISYMRGNKTM